MQSQDSQRERVIYDSGDAKLQWRCNLYYLHNPITLITEGLILLLLCLCFHLSPFFSVAAAVSMIALSYCQITATINKRASGPRVCTTIIDHDGLTDLTPDGEKRISWHRVRAIEMTKGDIYFLTWSGGSFVPASAFKSESSAQEYFKKARKLWTEYRQSKGRNLKVTPSSLGKDPAEAGKAAEVKSQLDVEALLAEDESVWKELEDEHKKK
jgi:hypothetical protein